LAGHLHDWLNLALRWAHLITGIAWIGASFYFNWLENRLNRRSQPTGIAGDLWAVHGGGFYHLRKLAVAPERLPFELHWFKWEAYATWWTGFALLCVVYYWDASVFLLAPGFHLPPPLGIALGVGALLASWLAYDLLCRLLAGHGQVLLAAAVLAWFTALAWALAEVFSARAAFVHTGAAIGTVMVANVFRVIIPAQKDLVDAVAEGREPEAAKGAAALLRSRHNNYLTLPVLFLMISIHYPGTYGHPRPWLVLLGISLGGVAIRHFFNIRHRAAGRAWVFLATGLGLLILTALLTAPNPPVRPAEAMAVPDDVAMDIVWRRCTGCHSRQPSLAGFTGAPLGIVLDTALDLQQQRQRVYRSVATRTMPLANLTQMTDVERETIVNWCLAEEHAGSLNE
jgi:uncharacterized membrane protein